MSKFTTLQDSSPYNYYYNTADKLFLHIFKIAEAAFDKADRRRNKIRTKEEFIKYQENARKTFLKCLGKTPYNNTLPLNAKVTGTSFFEGVKVENIIIELRKNFFATANLYIPENATDKLPGILFQCGHAIDGHFAYAYRRACITIAKAGNVVLAMAPIGQGERKNYPELLADFPVKEHQFCGNQCTLAGETLAKYFLADAMRGIDYLQQRPEVDADKIGATGSSGGGTMTAVLAAVDQRVKAAAPGTFITSRREYLHAGSPQDAEQIWPGATLNLFDHYELISCIRPRACMILGVKNDFFCREGTEAVYEKEKEFYKLLGVENKLQIAWDDSRHAYTANLAKAAADFFNEIFTGKKSDAEIVCPAEDYEHLMATKKGSVLEELNSALVYEENKKEFLKKKAKMTPEKIKAELTKKVFSFRDECKFNIRRLEELEIDDMYVQKVLWFSQKQLPCYGVLFTPLANKDANLPVTLCLWEGGTDKLVEKESYIDSLIKQGQAVFVADLSGMGKCTPNPMLKSQATAPFYTAVAKLNIELAFLGDSICALRVYDLIRCIDMLKENYGLDNVTVYTEGFYSVYSDVAEKVGCDFKKSSKKPIDIYSVITNKIYDDYHFADILMPGLGLYI